MKKNLQINDAIKKAKLITKKRRPKCEVPGCGKSAQNCGHGRYRKASWVRKKYNVKNGYVCQMHHQMKYKIGGWEYRIHRKNYCENKDGRLGFICTTTIVDTNWQLDADHIDGNHENNSKNNIQTLCKCCHAIKTRDNQDYLSKKVA
jgi:hypothetical protein